MRNTLLQLLKIIIDDEVFLSKHTNNSFIDIGKLNYIDFVVYCTVLYNNLKEEAERIENNFNNNSKKKIHVKKNG